MPGGPFSYDSDRMSVSWQVEAKLVSRRKTVWRDLWFFELRP